MSSHEGNDVMTGAYDKPRQRRHVGSLVSSQCLFWVFNLGVLSWRGGLGSYDYALAL